ncbi:MAG TPA: hypothetical protein VFU04_05690 [Solirubrobacterales bacterium]|nr:hypothetical protein [Solirubrobacterales bacterium]
MTATLALLAGTSGAQQPENAEIWCLDPANRERVVRTAELLGLGASAGADRARLVPRGSNRAMSLGQWRHARPGDFQRACAATHGAFAVPPAPQAGPIEDGTTGTDFAVAVGAGLISSAAGGVIGYQLSRRARSQERRYQEDVVLQTELTELVVEVDRLEERTRSGTATGSDTLAVRERAVRLLRNLSRSPSFESETLVALSELIGVLEAPSLEDDELNASQLSRVRKRIEDSCTGKRSQREQEVNG